MRDVAPAVAGLVDAATNSHFVASSAVLLVDVVSAARPVAGGAFVLLDGVGDRALGVGASFMLADLMLSREVDIAPVVLLADVSGAEIRASSVALLADMTWGPMVDAAGGLVGLIDALAVGDLLATTEVVLVDARVSDGVDKVSAQVLLLDVVQPRDIGVGLVGALVDVAPTADVRAGSVLLLLDIDGFTLGGPASVYRLRKAKSIRDGQFYPYGSV